MNGMLKKAGLGAVLAATVLTAAVPAEAQRWGGYRNYRGHRGGGDAVAGAVLGGILGLGVGAAIASNNNRNRYYDRGYYYDAPPPRVVYRERYYSPPPRVVVRERYYEPGYYDRGYYDRGYDGYGGYGY
ncbi:hypothetical protein [Sphingomonas mollis]|uniref:17 kDa surface antigen n=1 Tax=Sphingomonas mollis TaxID=2795726 RepID=A0ABS0XRR9_9SPHN|nr:hypothetical protein [Sphingomonas sp. BT553]MBJ6122719.1 hypothetical protein [Sphingomonas sp. BT553]